MRSITIVLVLGAFWLLLSGHYTTWINSLGVISILLVTAVVLRMDKIDASPVNLHLGWRLFKYLVWLFSRVIIANIEVAQRVLQPKMPIEPVWGKVDVDVDSPLQKTLYANSVTITPDTLTVKIADDHFLVHALWPESIQCLRDGGMEKHVKETKI